MTITLTNITFFLIVVIIVLCFMAGFIYGYLIGTTLIQNLRAENYELNLKLKQRGLK